MEYGAQCVMTAGMTMMRPWYVLNWDSPVELLTPTQRLGRELVKYGWTTCTVLVLKQV